jgi:thymidylate kinase
MAKSKLRGGSKAHKSRVSKRNIKQKNDFNQVNKKVQEEMRTKFEEMSEQHNDIVEVGSDEPNKEGV